MSAIAGIYQFHSESSPWELGRNLMKSLEKYPADDVQTWTGEQVFLGCHAQWITPESIGEIVPYYDAESKLAITADAIIDNREELFEGLQVETSVRKKISDTELILLAYQKWGEDSPKYLVGDFAYVIWDHKKHHLFAARDFSGSRTLYFYRNEKCFAFCTTIKPLFSLPFVKKELNEQWLAEYLAIPEMYDSVDTLSTAYKHIEQVPPSHSMTVSDGKVIISRYCKLYADPQLQLKSNHEYEEAFGEVFQLAVNSRLRTHGRVGAYLSGGLDSGSVVSFAVRALRKENKQLQTFSYVPVDDFIDWTPRSRMADERSFIQSTVQHVGNIADHYLSFKDKSPLSEVDDWLEILEMPYKFFENSFWLKGIYEEASQKGLKVLLNGSRGNNTISWGPALDYYAILLRKMSWIRLYQELCLYSRNVGLKRSKILSVVRKKAFPIVERIFPSKDQLPMLINPEFAKRTQVFEKLQKNNLNPAQLARQNEFEARKEEIEPLYVRGNSGASRTKLSLRNSLWDRDPTNDLRVVRFCLSIPDDQYVQNGLDRALVRRATKTLLPDKVRLNQRIRGLQGADGVHRMRSSWNQFIEELHLLCRDQNFLRFVNLPVLKEAISKISDGPRPEYIAHMEFKYLMRSLIVYRFTKNFT